MAAPFRQRFPLSVSSAGAILRCRGTVAAIIGRCLTASPVVIGRPSGFFGVGVTPGSALGVMGGQDPGFPGPAARKLTGPAASCVPKPSWCPGRALPAVAAARHRHRCRLRFLESVTGPCLGQGSSSPACPRSRGRIAGELTLPRSRTSTPPAALLQPPPEPAAGRTLTADRGTPAPAPSWRSATPPTRSSRSGMP